jgi:TolB-like protein/class 3 adenylate cyclase
VNLAGGKRKLTTILAADVVGYSRLVASDDEAAIRRLHDLSRVMSGIVARHDGRVFGAAGDSLMAEFPSAVEAARCALEIQEEIADRSTDLKPERAMLFRIGINVGETIIEGDNLFGDGVNIAARLQEVAEPGGIVLSAAAYDQIKNKVSIEVEPLGPRSLKNIPEPVTAFRVRIAHRAAVPLAEVTAGYRWKRRTVAAGIALFAVIGSYIAWDTLVAPGSRLEAFKAQAAQPIPDYPSIVVMPFLNASDSEAQEYFCLGIAEDIMTSLTKVSGLFVVGRDSAMSFKGKTVPARQVGRELGVRYVLQGSVRRAESRVRISTSLVDAATEQTVWAARYDRELGDIFAVQDDIAEKIVQSLSVSFLPGERENVRLQVAQATQSRAAHDLFLQARSKMLPPTRANLDEAEKFFREVKKLDAQYGDGRAALSHVLSLKVAQGFVTDPAARIAMQNEAEQEGREALAFIPGSPKALYALAVAEVRQGHHREALRHAREAYRISSRDAEVAATLGYVLMFSGQPQAAYFPLDEAIDLERVAQHKSRAHFFKLVAAYEAKDFKTADASYLTHMAVSGGQCLRTNCAAYAAATKLRRAQELEIEASKASGADKSRLERDKDRYFAEAKQVAETFQKLSNPQGRIAALKGLYASKERADAFEADVRAALDVK